MHETCGQTANRPNNKQAVGVGTISFVKTKRNRTHDAQKPSESFQTASLHFRETKQCVCMKLAAELQTDQTANKQ